jgi:hypothetical protein
MVGNIGGSVAEVVVDDLLFRIIGEGELLMDYLNRSVSFSLDSGSGSAFGEYFKQGVQFLKSKGKG